MKTIIILMTILLANCTTYDSMQYREMEEVEGNPFLEGLYVWWHMSH